MWALLNFVMFGFVFGFLAITVLWVVWGGLFPKHFWSNMTRTGAVTIFVFWITVLLTYGIGVTVWL